MPTRKKSHSSSRLLLALTSAAALFQATAPDALQAQTASVTVDVAATGHRIGAMHYGAFFEEINRAGSGGLWSELLLNRSFENGDPLEGWSAIAVGGATGSLSTNTSDQLNANNRTQLAVTTGSAGSSGRYGVANRGFFNALPVVSGKTYNTVVYLRKDAAFAGDVTIRLEDDTGDASNIHTVANGSLAAGWTKFSFPLVATRSVSAARLAVTTQSAGTFYITYASLMPADAADGFRADLFEKIKALKPGFLRFPGGCYVEGDYLANAWQWKGGIGPQESRRTHSNLWGYWDNNGLGLYEYLILCERIGMKPLLVVNAGMSHNDTVTGSALAPYIQDALDALEFCNGSATSTWGAQRAAMGHAAPFNLEYLQIGNENSGDVYNANYAAISAAVRAAYPAVKLVADTWDTPSDSPADIVDEHYYPGADWFAQQSHRYDTYTRTGKQIYVGEYAVTSGGGLGNVSAALGEATWMMGMERNSDLVTMTSYAPLFTHVSHRAWSPDLICFDNTASYGTPSFYVNKLMSANKGDVNLSTTSSGPNRTFTMLNGGVGVGTWNTSAEYSSVTVTSGSTVLYQSNFAAGTSGWTGEWGNWSVSGGNLLQSNATLADCRYVYYLPAWTNYTLDVRARKLAGTEGFLILFRATDHDNLYWWNLGGWGNTLSLVERNGSGSKTSVVPSVATTIATDVWYDIRVVANNNTFQCYLKTAADTNYTLVHEFTDNPSFPGFDATATREDVSGDILVKVVNRTDNTLTNTPIVLNNSGWTSVNAIVSTLSGANAAENSLANPTAIAPVVTQLTEAALPLSHTFPPRSFTILRLASATGTAPVPGGTYRVVSKLSGKSLDAIGSADGAQIIQWPYWGGSNQQWIVNHLGNGEYSMLNAAAPAKGLDIAWGSTDNGATVQLWPYWGGAMQRFKFTPTGGGSFRITPVSAPGACLDVKDVSTADGALIQQWGYWGGSGQQWTLQPQ